MPRKVFVAGEILTAADVNTNLMDQAVMVFADSTARTAAIPTPSEGMITYLQDTDAVEKYDGSNFVNVDTGKILQVVSSSPQTPVSTTLGTFQTGFSLSITPSNTANKILAMVDVPASHANTSTGCIVTLFRGTTSGTNLGNGTSGFGELFNNAARTESPFSLNFLDSPSTTSVQTYTVAFRSTGPGNTVTLMPNNLKATITLMEVAG